MWPAERTLVYWLGILGGEGAEFERAALFATVGLLIVFFSKIGSLDPVGAQARLRCGVAAGDPVYRFFAGDRGDGARGSERAVYPAEGHPGRMRAERAGDGVGARVDTGAGALDAGSGWERGVMLGSGGDAG